MPRVSLLPPKEQHLVCPRSQQDLGWGLTTGAAPGTGGFLSLPAQVGLHADHHLFLHGQPGCLPDGAAHGRAH